jgi:hypothetical protein
MNGVMKNPGTYFVAVKPELGSGDWTFPKFIIFTVDPILDIKPKPDPMQKKERPRK